jgi:hypothetical protein
MINTLANYYFFPWSSNSPYINHFVSADTVVPGYTNPQNLNRYSYVGNNPLRYTDPSGHMMVEDEGSTKGGLDCSKYPQYCSNGKKKSNKELQAMHPKQGQVDRLKIYGGEYIFWGYGGNLTSWNGDKEIDPAEWEALLYHIGYDVHNFSTGWYDTPLFDGFGYLSGTGCINGKCYDRSELNYVGEGEALAALGLSNEATHNIVWTWKNQGNIVWCALGVECSFRKPSQGTIDMTDIGWEFYHEYYSSPSHSLDTFTVVPPGIATSILR